MNPNRYLCQSCSCDCAPTEYRKNSGVCDCCALDRSSDAHYCSRCNKAISSVLQRTEQPQPLCNSCQYQTQIPTKKKDKDLMENDKIKIENLASRTVQPVELASECFEAYLDYVSEVVLNACESLYLCAQNGEREFEFELKCEGDWDALQILETQYGICWRYDQYSEAFYIYF